MFYPLKQGQKIPGTRATFDELAYYAERFNTVEINNTSTSACLTSRLWVKSWNSFRPNSKPGGARPAHRLQLNLFQDFTAGGR